MDIENVKRLKLIFVDFFNKLETIKLNSKFINILSNMLSFHFNDKNENEVTLLTSNFKDKIEIMSFSFLKKQDFSEALLFFISLIVQKNNEDTEETFISEEQENKLVSDILKKICYNDENDIEIESLLLTILNQKNYKRKILNYLYNNKNKILNIYKQYKENFIEKIIEEVKIIDVIKKQHENLSLNNKTTNILVKHDNNKKSAEHDIFKDAKLVKELQNIDMILPLSDYNLKFKIRKKEEVGKIKKKKNKKLPKIQM